MLVVIIAVMHNAKGSKGKSKSKVNRNDDPNMWRIFFSDDEDWSTKNPTERSTGRNESTENNYSQSKSSKNSTTLRTASDRQGEGVPKTQDGSDSFTYSPPPRTLGRELPDSDEEVELTNYSSDGGIERRPNRILFTKNNGAVKKDRTPDVKNDYIEMDGISLDSSPSPTSSFPEGSNRIIIRRESDLELLLTPRDGRPKGLSRCCTCCKNHSPGDACAFMDRWPRWMRIASLTTLSIAVVIFYVTVLFLIIKAATG